MKKLHTAIKIGTAVLMGIVMLAGCGKAEKAPETTPAAATQPETIPAASFAPPAVRDGVQTMLFACIKDREDGGSSDSYQNGGTADFLMLLVVDETAGKTSAVQLNPDTQVAFDVPGKDTRDMPVGSVYSYGSGGSDSCLYLKKSVAQLLGGIPIDHYMNFTDTAIGTVHEMLGSIAVNITDSFPESYPNLQKGENVTLSGEDAAVFFTYRDGGDADNALHMKRQREYITKLFAPFFTQAQQEDFLTQLTLKIGDGMATDLTLSQMMQMMELLGKTELSEDALVIPGRLMQQDGESRYIVEQSDVEKVLAPLLYEP